MKKLIEDTNDGLIALIGEKVTIFSCRYIYTGTLVGINDTCIKLKDPAIVYETGCYTKKDWQDCQSLNVPYFYVSTASIESFGILK